MKIIKSLLLVFLMLFSIPIAIADEHETLTREQAESIALKSVPGTVVEFESELEDGTTVYEFKISTRDGIVEVEIDASTGEILEIELDDDIEDEVNDDDEVKSEIKLRDGKVEIKERIRAANNALEIRKERREEDKERTELRVKLKDCRANSEECREIKIKVKTRGISGLEARIDAVIAFLENLKERVEASDIDNKEAALERIENQIAEMIALKERIEGLDEDSTKEEIKDVTTDVKDTWIDSRKHTKINALKVVNHGLEGVLQRSENLKERLQRTLDRLEENGYDVSTASAELELFNMAVDEAVSIHNQAKDSLASAENSDRQETIKEVHSLMREARDKLKEAHEHLRNFSQEVKELNSSAEEEDEE